MKNEIMTDRYFIISAIFLIFLDGLVNSAAEIRSHKGQFDKNLSRNSSILDHFLGSSLNSTESNGSFFNDSFLNGSHHGRESKKGGMHVMTLQYEYVQNPLLITIFLMAICIVKIVIEHCHCLNQAIPESCLLMVFGLGIGFLMHQNNAKSELDFLKFGGRSFFLFLLPPIVLQSAYSLKDRAFADNLGTILLYAVLGTILNVVIVGPALYGFYKLGAMGSSWQVTFLECILFSIIVAAVDPVAVLAIFQNMGVNKLLHFLVFGESLFNDGVAVVMYDTITNMMEIDTIGPTEFAMGFAAFLCVCLGAMVIGILMGFMSAFITKYTEKIQTVEPFVLYGFAYLSYLLAELCNFSGIISLICCGLIQAHYAMENISSRSFIAVHQFSKLQSGLAESLIFIILSVMAVNVKKAWADFNVGFAVLAVVMCIVARFIVTCGLAYCVNHFLLGFRTIKKRDQFVMAYGGLRGAMTFSLVFSLRPDLLLEKDKTHNILLTSAYVVIFFTTFLQGITMKPIVKFLQVRLHEGDSTLFDEVNLMVLENTSACIERISGTRGNNYWAAISKRLSRRFLRPLVNKKLHRKKVRSVLPEYWQARILTSFSVEETVIYGDQIIIPRGQLELLDVLNISDDTPVLPAVDFDTDAILEMQQTYAKEFIRRTSVDNALFTADGIGAVSKGAAKIMEETVEEEPDCSGPSNKIVSRSSSHVSDQEQALVEIYQDDNPGITSPLRAQHSDGSVIVRRENKRRKTSVLSGTQNEEVETRINQSDGVENKAFDGDTRV